MTGTLEGMAHQSSGTDKHTLTHTYTHTHTHTYRLCITQPAPSLSHNLALERQQELGTAGPTKFAASGALCHTPAVQFGLHGLAQFSRQEHSVWQRVCVCVCVWNHIAFSSRCFIPQVFFCSASYGLLSQRFLNRDRLQKAAERYRLSPVTFRWRARMPRGRQISRLRVMWKSLWAPCLNKHHYHREEWRDWPSCGDCLPPLLSQGLRLNLARQPLLAFHTDPRVAGLRFTGKQTDLLVGFAV